MKKSLFEDYSIDWFFLIASSGAYFLGVVSSKPEPGNWNLTTLFAGLLLFIALYGLQRIASQKANKKKTQEIPFQTKARNKVVLAWIPSLILFAVIFSCLYFLLQQQVLIGINLVWFALISFFLFFQSSSFAGQGIRSVEWFFKSIIVSPLLIVFGISVQAVPLLGIHYLLALPLFFLSASSFIALEFPIYARSSTDRLNSIIERIGLEKVISMHNILLVLSFASLTAYLYFSASWRTHWPAILIALISLTQMFLLHRIAQGLKPNYALIRTTAYLQTLTYIYIFIFNSLI